MRPRPIDVRYLGVDQAAWAFLIGGPLGQVLVECGPAASWPHLEQGLVEAGVSAAGIGDLLLTHIHLDHAGAAGHLAAQGARVHVHPFGAPHLVDPAKLIASSRRVHGDAYDRFYGDLKPVPADQVCPTADDSIVNAAGLRCTALHTPGHARHHVVWLMDAPGERHAFMGDLAGIHVPESEFLLMPTPPPEFDPVAWVASLRKVREAQPTHLWLTHGGLVAADRSASRQFLERAEQEIRREAEALRGAIPLDAEEAERAVLDRLRPRAERAGVSPRRMAQFVDQGFARMNLAGARRAFPPRS